MTRVERGRLDALLSAERVGEELDDAPLLVAAADLGALDAVGRRSPTLDVEGSFYVLASWAEAERARRRLAELVEPGQGERVEAVQNGLLAGVIRATIEGPEGDDAHDLFSNLLSAFAGDE